MKMVVHCETPPAIYTPYDSGTYRVEPGLLPLDTSFGNGRADRHVFQIDSDFQRFRTNGDRARAAGLSKYPATSEFPPSVESAILSFIVHQLGADHPEQFRFENAVGHPTLMCVLTGETLRFEPDFRLAPNSDGEYVSALDALAAQVQEDLAVVHIGADGDKLVAVHAVAPSGWDPREKIGKGFADIHAPVAEIATLSKRGPNLMKAIAEGGRFQRFVWGVTTDRNFDHHPESPAAAPFDPMNPHLFVRIERQVMIGLEEVSAFLFGIHTYFADCATISPDQRTQLRSGLLSMSSASRRYKGVAESLDDITTWLEKE